MFIDSIKSSFTSSFDSWSTDRKTVDTQLKFQVDIGSAQNNNSPKNLIVAHQTENKIGVPNKAENIADFDNLNMRKDPVDIVGVRYPRNVVNIDHGLNGYLDQYRDLQLFYEKYVGEELLNAFISYTVMKNKYPIQVIDLRIQVDHINPQKTQLFQEYRSATNIARLFMILIRHREIRMISDSKKISVVDIIQNDNT